MKYMNDTVVTGDSRRAGVTLLVRLRSDTKNASKLSKLRIQSHNRYEPKQNNLELPIEYI